MNRLNIAASKRLLHTKLEFTPKLMIYVSILYSIGYLHRYLIKHEGTKKFLYLSILRYKNTPFFGYIKLVTTKSRKHRISYRALVKLRRPLQTSIMILSTSTGLITHHEALKRRIGGDILFIVL